MPARDCVIRATCKQLGIAVLVVVACVSSVRGDAANAFLPASGNPSSTPLHNAGIGAPKERFVRIARNDLASVRSQVASSGAGRLLLNVDAELELDVALERTSPTRWGYSLSGRIDNPTVGFVTLVVHDEAVAGAIWTPDASYDVVHLGGGVHAVREVPAGAPQCSGLVAASDAQPLVRPENTPAEDENTVVDVLVVWTPQREEMSGGVEGVQAEIDLAIAYTNDAFERSGAFVSLNLVGAEPTDYNEGREDLGRLIRRSDGHMDGVHRRRDALGADLVSLATTRGGVALVGGAFSVMGGSDPRTAAHEFGHNFGLSHERSEWWSGFTSTYPRHYEHGYVALRSWSAHCTSTIMAYGRNLCRRPPDRIPLYSSPALLHPGDGVSLGVSRFSDRRGADGPADAVAHLNRVRSTIANFRPSRSRPSE